MMSLLMEDTEQHDENWLDWETARQSTKMLVQTESSTEGRLLCFPNMGWNLIQQSSKHSQTYFQTKPCFLGMINVIAWSWMEHRQNVFSRLKRSHHHLCWNTKLSFSHLILHNSLGSAYHPVTFTLKQRRGMYKLKKIVLSCLPTSNSVIKCPTSDYEDWKQSTTDLNPEKACPERCWSSRSSSWCWSIWMERSCNWQTPPQPLCHQLTGGVST